MKNWINSENYVENSIRTESKDFEKIKERLNDPTIIRLLHSFMGLTTETGELMDVLKKYIYYGKSMDETNLVEEIGDESWYLAIAIDTLKTTMNEILTMNIEKLKKRYPEKFTEDAAINRNVVNEMKAFD